MAVEGEVLAGVELEFWAEWRWKLEWGRSSWIDSLIEILCEAL